MKHVLQVLLWALALYIVIPRRVPVPAREWYLLVPETSRDWAGASPSMIVFFAIAVGSFFGQHDLVRWSYYVYLVSFFLSREV